MDELLREIAQGITFWVAEEEGRLLGVMGIQDKDVASWAIDFYRRNGFAIVPEQHKARLLRTYWSIPERQIETSVVLADRRWMQKQQLASADV